MTLLRAELLQGRAVALAGGVTPVLKQGLSALGARVENLDDLGELADGEVADGEVGRWAREHRPFHALVYDARKPFGVGGTQGLLDAMQSAWAAVREVATGAFIEAPGPGRVVLIAPSSTAGPHAEAARAALENLARTLSIEWARHEVTVMMLAPGEATDERELTDLVCYLCSHAGGYLSGCRLELGALPG